MQSAELRQNETESLSALHAPDVLDSAPDGEFDALVRAASIICGTPVALISLIDADRQWLKANFCLPGFSELPRATAFCAQTVLSDRLLEVTDATLDPRFADNPLVIGDPQIRFYAGAPVRLSNGHRIGSLCVLDYHARTLDDTQRELLLCLALAVARALEGRAASRLLLQTTERAQEELLHAQDEVTLRQQTERELLDEQWRLANIIEATGVGTWEWNVRTGEMRVNARYAQLIGCMVDDPMTASPMLSSDWDEHIHPDDSLRSKRLLTQHFEQHSDRYACEMRLMHGDDHWVWVMDRGQVISWGEDGAPEWMFGSRQDISERKQQEAALRKSEALLDRTGRLAGVGGWAFDLIDNVLTWSDETCRIHGTASDYQPTLTEAINFYPAEARPLILATIDCSIASGESWEMELPLVRADGVQIWTRSIGTVEFENGRAVRLVGAFQDITERKLQDLKLTAALTEAQDLYDNAPCGYYSLDADGRFLHVNAVALAWLGCSREALIGKRRMTDFLMPESQTLFHRDFSKFQFEGRVKGHEFELLVPHAAPRRVSVNATAVRDAEGNFLMARTAMFDITESHAAKKALRELTAIFDNTSDFVVQTDRHGNIVYMNPSVRQATGIGADEPVTHLDYARFYTPETLRLYAEVIMPAVNAGAPVWVGEATVYLVGQRAVPVNQIVIAHRDSQGRIERLSAVIRDIESEVEAKRQLLLQTATLSSVTESIPSTVAVVGSDGVYRFVNGAFERWIGMPRDAIVGQPVSLILGESELRRRMPWVKRAFAGESVNFALDYPSPQGTTYLAMNYLPLRLETGKIDGFVVMTQNITQQKQEELRLLQLASRDPLTDLLNRAGFEQHMDRLLQEGQGAALAVLYIDLDHFKPVNDQHGHPVGDQVLEIFAQRLSALVRFTDAVARLGGDEFAIVLTGTTGEASAQTVADKVLAAAHTPFKVGNLTIHIGASVGVAFDADRHFGWQGLVQRADAELLLAKASGRGRQAGASR
jgi:diguanylate cyclase (GGDEF)-like protein/PAS domain S-box-containing protein